MKLTIALVLIASVALAGCARHRITNPDAVNVQGLIVDGKGKDLAKLQQDGVECAGIAQAAAPAARAVAGAIAGAVAGALLGALVFRSSGLSGNAGATFGSGVGALTGAGEGAASGAQDYRTVLRNCMAGRGHMPLN
jgi:hypothetical protein